MTVMESHIDNKTPSPPSGRIISNSDVGSTSSSSQNQKGKINNPKSGTHHTPNINANNNNHHNNAHNASKKTTNKKHHKEKDLDFAQIKNGKKAYGSNRKNQVSINHLLDFQTYHDSEEYQERRRNHNASRNRRRSSSSHGRQRINPFKVNLKGMSYINCHYKFVVDYRSDYKAQQLDPNIPVQVSDILRIITPKGNACPICLSEDPIAPRMITSCGHILCLPCLLSLLDSEVPTSNAKKLKSDIIEKYNDCPLCSTIIRKKDLKPVLISNLDERFEVPKVNDEVALSLMSRQQNKVLSLPKTFEDYHRMIETFPWVYSEEDTDNDADTKPNFTMYSRILLGDLQYLLTMYEVEKQQILAQYKQEKELYDDDGKFYNLALDNIDQDVKYWKERFESDLPASITTNGQHYNHKNNNVANNGSPMPPSTYFYYETGFNAASTYVLSPLDMKVLKHSYGDDYANLPSAIIAKVENIKYEEFNEELALTKFKFLSHIPFGTTIGFMECNWSHNEFIRPETWDFFKGDLTARTKTSNRKFKREEINRKKALNEEEIRSREFYERENNGLFSNGIHNSHSLDHYDDSSAGGSFSSMTRNLGSLTITDYRDLPALSSDANQSTTGSGEQGGASSGSEESASGSPKYQTTIWGTKIPKAESPVIEDSEDDWDAVEMIRRAREEMDRQEMENAGNNNKRKKKKKVLLSSAW